MSAVGAASLSAPEAGKSECEGLADSFGRRIRKLRVSVTDRCNFRCRYCMPAGGLPLLEKEGLLDFDEVHRLVKIFVGLGIREVRLTGGEPTLRPGLPSLVKRLSQIEGLDSVNLTTNGFSLSELARPLSEAGMRRINVSLDALSRTKFLHMTRRDAFDRVMKGLEEAEKYRCFSPIKVNAVAMRGFTEEEILPLVELARQKPYVVRFIEFMPLDAEGNWRREEVLTGGEILQIIGKHYSPVPIQDANPSSTARRYRFADGPGEIGLINCVSEPFCSTCNRIRLTADGQLRTCLFSLEETDLRGSMRRGASDRELAEMIVAGVKRKELKHKINEGAAFQRAARSMSQIGG